MRPFKLTWLVPVVAFASACSFAIVKRPPQETPKHGRLDCTTARDAPQTDMVLAAVPVGIALACGSLALKYREGVQPNPPGKYHTENPAPAIFAVTCVLPAMLVALVPLTSMVYGYVYTGRCRQLQRDRLVPPLIAPQSQPSR